MCFYGSIVGVWAMCYLSPNYLEVIRLQWVRLPHQTLPRWKTLMLPMVNNVVRVFFTHYVMWYVAFYTHCVKCPDSFDIRSFLSERLKTTFSFCDFFNSMCFSKDFCIWCSKRIFRWNWFNKHCPSSSNRPTFPGRQSVRIQQQCSDTYGGPFIETRHRTTIGDGRTRQTSTRASIAGYNWNSTTFRGSYHQVSQLVYLLDTSFVGYTLDIPLFS